MKSITYLEKDFGVNEIAKNINLLKLLVFMEDVPKSTNTESSDVDLWIKVDNLKEKKIIELASELRKK